MALKHEAVVDSWNTLILSGAGNGSKILGRVERMIRESKMPGILVERRDVSSSLIFGAKRDFLVAMHQTLRDYRIYIGARDFGSNLDVSWYLTIQPRFLKRTISRYAMGNPQALSWQIDFFSRQDLNAFATSVHAYVKETVKELLEELKQDPTGFDPKSKGFLSVW